MTLQQFKKKVEEAYKANNKDIKEIEKWAEEENVEPDEDYELGYQGAMEYVLKLLEEVK